MKSNVCPLCNSAILISFYQSKEFFFKKATYQYVKCNNCNHVFVNPLPDEETLKKFYEKVIPKLRELYPIERSEKELIENISEQEKISFLRESSILANKGKALDIGFGKGGFLLSMQKEGWNGTGIEFSEEVELSDVVKNKFIALFGANAFSEIGENKYELITMWHVLEHISYPVEILKTAVKYLSDEGKFIVAVPNLDSLSGKLFGRFWYGAIPPWHLHLFSPETLKYAFNQAGLKVETIQGFGTMERYLLWLESFNNIYDDLAEKNSNAALLLTLKIIRKVFSLTSRFIENTENFFNKPSALIVVGTLKK